MVSSKEQFEIMRRAMEEEHSKDLAALERLQRFLPPADGEKRVEVVAPAPAAEPEAEEEQGASERPTLIGAVLAVLQSKNMSMTGRHVLTALQSQGFPFVGDERRRLTSIGQALSKLAERDPAPIRVIRRGKGKAPNVYRASLTTVNQAHLPNATGQVSNDLTM